MNDDYRNTIYCPKLDGIKDRKKDVEDMIKKDHRRARDMHAYVSVNDDIYKNMFIEAYNGKCSYCGVSNDIIPKDSFEIDHFFCKELFSPPAKAGYMDNLVLACHTCNHNKSSFVIPPQYVTKLHPDTNGITAYFERDEEYYIRIVAENKDSLIMNFYDKLRLGDELRRLDYLLMSIYGLQKILHSMSGMAEVYEKMGRVVELLRKKRNMTYRDK